MRLNAQFIILLISTILCSCSIFEPVICTANTDPQRLTLTIPKSTESIHIKGIDFSIVSIWKSPLTNQQNDKWIFGTREEHRKVLAGEIGTLVSDQFSAGDLTLTREIWHSLDKNVIAIRQKLWNRSKKSLQLKALVPLCCKGDGSLIIADERNVGNWDVLMQQRSKKGRPQTIQPYTSEKHEADQFVILRNRNDPEKLVLLMGYLSQTEHCARLWLDIEQSGRETYLKEFSTECEFDNVLVPAGGERTSQWVLIMNSKDPNALIADYADRVGVYHGVKQPPKNAPSVFCSWYFHLRGFIK